MDDEDYFKLKYQDGLVAVIFNHFKFSNPRAKPRWGTNVNRNDAKKCLTSLGFKVHVENDCNVDQIRKTLIYLSNVANLKCLAVVILTHGNSNGFLHAYDCCYHKNMLFTIFKNKLHHIPKLFFFQACRGCLIDKGKPDSDQGNPIINYKYGGQDTFYVPNLLCHYSTSESYVSFRDVFTGSKYVKILCDTIREYWESLDLVSILTIVNYKMAVHFTVTARGRFKDGKQMPQIVTTMKKLVVFTKE